MPWGNEQMGVGSAVCVEECPVGATCVPQETASTNPQPQDLPIEEILCKADARFAG